MIQTYRAKRLPKRNGREKLPDCRHDRLLFPQRKLVVFRSTERVGPLLIENVNLLPPFQRHNPAVPGPDKLRSPHDT